MFKLNNVSKKYGDNLALNNISLSISKGINFIVGGSGSGKSSLLRIISGIDNQYDGEVTFNNQELKKISPKEKSCLYNNAFGFIWQDFNLLEDWTVLDNILLPMQLKDKVDISQARKLLQELKLQDLENKKVKFLSGGQKQRVAIARELMKNPKVIVADEPTSALDKQTAKEIMKIFRKIAKDRIVIVVTHDTSHILATDTVFELDKGELLSTHNTKEVNNEGRFTVKETVFPFKQMFSVIKTNILCNKGRFLISVLSLIMGICFLTVTATNSISNQSQTAFDKLFDMYGEQVLDINLYNSFTGGADTGGGAANTPNVDVNQQIGGLYAEYQNDERADFITYVEPFSKIMVQAGDKTYTVQDSGNMPIINHLVAGRMSKTTEKEVVVPEQLVKNMGLTPEQALNQNITFNGEVSKWDKNKLSLIPVSIEVKIVGVADVNMIMNDEGEKFEYAIEDSFFFSEAALIDLLQQGNKDTQNLNILIRAKTPTDMIALKDELNKKGIVPLGNFEVIEDIVRLNSQSTGQTATASMFITILIIIMISAIALITGMLRKHEYAVFKVSGFSNANMRKLNLLEAFVQMICSFVIVVILAPIINMISQNIFYLRIIAFDSLGVTVLLLFTITMLSFIITDIIAETTSILKSFQSGDQ